MKTRAKILSTLLCIPLSIPATAAETQEKQTEVKVQKTSLTREQEIQIGKEAAAQVEREMEVVKNPQVEAWLNDIGQKLAKTPQANNYPYYFKLINNTSVNAFALPGGPMYVFTGLIKAADSEDEVAGVLAHEMSHVALRHGAAQMGKQQTWGTIFGAIGAAVGIAGAAGGGGCGMLCQVGQVGAGLGGMAVMTKFSRGFEKDADLNGARMMASAGYNPMALPTFFEKLEKEAGSADKSSGLASFFSDHPPNADRVQYISEDIKFYPQRTYNASTGRFDEVKRTVGSMRGPKDRPAALLAAKQGATARTNLPQGYNDYQAGGFAIAFPGDWQAGVPQGGGAAYMIPQGGAVQQQNGGLELLAGGMIGYFVPEGGADAVNLQKSTTDFLENLKKGDPSLKAGPPSAAQVGGRPAMRTTLTAITSRRTNQTVQLYTVARAEGLWYMVLAAPSESASAYEPVFRQMVATVQFPN